MVFVDAAGGGIQSAGWTAEVLTRLDERYGTGFSDRVVQISSVSGGSVGNLMYLAGHQGLRRFHSDIDARIATPQFVGISSRSSVAQSRLLDPGNAAWIRDAATRPALKDVVWGLAYPDLVRYMVPNLSPPTIDRGWALENAWRRALDEPASGAAFGSSRTRYGSDTRMVHLADAVRTGDLPIPVFNATSVESGRRVLLSPVLFPKHDVTGIPFDQYADQAPRGLLPMVTAARLSSLFPVVSPNTRGLFVQRPDGDQNHAGHGAKDPSTQNPTADRPTSWLEENHMADGGYTDNEGLLATIESIRIMVQQYEDLRNRDPQVPPLEILLIRIEGFPIDHGEGPMQPNQAPSFSSWFGPLLTMMNVRVASQQERGEIELDLLQQGLPSDVTLHPIMFEFRPHDGIEFLPLSWRLTPTQKGSYREVWNRFVNEADQAARQAMPPRELNPVMQTDLFFPVRK